MRIVQGDDTELCETGTERACAPEGAPPSRGRLTPDLHGGETVASADGLPSDASPSDQALPSCDVCDAGGLARDAFDFVAVDAHEKAHDECVSTIKAFMRGGFEGMDRLRKVLPNIFKHFKELDERAIMQECNLLPSACRKRARSDDLDAGPRKPFSSDEDEELYRSQELIEAYEAARGEWSS